MSPYLGIISALCAILLTGYFANGSAVSVSCSSSANGTSSSSTTTQTIQVWNRATGAWDTVVNTTSSNSSSCNSPTLTGWKDFVLFEENMKDWSYEKWVEYYLQVITQKDWDFNAFLNYIEANQTDCSEHAMKTLHTSTVLNLFSVLKNFESRYLKERSCRWLRQGLEKGKEVQDFCMSEGKLPDRGEDSAHSGAMTARMHKVHAGEMAALEQVVCSASFSGSGSVWASENATLTCDLGGIESMVLASLHARMGWNHNGSCSDATEAQEAIETALMSCNSRLVFMLGGILRQLDEKRRMLCSSPTCNVEYARSCIQDAEMTLKRYTSKPDPGNNGTDPERKLAGFCRGMKSALACVGNHTISCGAHIYGDFSERFQTLRQTFGHTCRDFKDDAEEGNCPPRRYGEIYTPDDNEHYSGNENGNGNENHNRSLAIIQELALHSIFDDNFLCQALLANGLEGVDVGLTFLFCGFKDAENWLACYNNSHCPSDSVTYCEPAVEECDKSYQSCAFIKSQTGSTRHLQYCAATHQCNTTLLSLPSGEVKCCDGLLCNKELVEESCVCSTDTVREWLESNDYANKEALNCTEVSSIFPTASLGGCTAYQRQTALRTLESSGVAAKCPELRGKVTHYTGDCPGHCYDIGVAEKLCSTVHKNICGAAYSDCIAMLLAPCSVRHAMEGLFRRWQISYRCNGANETYIAAPESENELLKYSTTFIKPIECVKRVIFSSPWYDGLEAISNCMKTEVANPGDNPVAATIIHVTDQLLDIGPDDGMTDSCKNQFPFMFMNFQTLFSSSLYGDRSSPCRVVLQAVEANAYCTEEVKIKVIEALASMCGSFFIKEDCSEEGVKQCFWEFATSGLKPDIDKLFNCTTTAADNCQTDVAKGYVKGFTLWSLMRLAHSGVIGQDSDDSNGSNDIDDGNDVEGPHQDGTGEGVKLHLYPMEWFMKPKPLNGTHGNDTETCVCDPARAVHCVLDVHHLSKQSDPDFESLCPMVDKSSKCAHHFVKDCDKCRQETVKEIVETLNRGLEKTCVDPPPSACKSITARKCVDQLLDFQKMLSGDEDNTEICVEISKVNHCLDMSLQECEISTETQIRFSFDKVKAMFVNVTCEDAVDQLITCRDRFSTQVYGILGFDMETMLIKKENGDMEQYMEFSGMCKAMTQSWKCVSSTLDIDKGKRGNKIVRDSLEVLFKSVYAICEPLTDPLECYSCQGEGSNSCANKPNVETCNSNQICQTKSDTKEVVSRGCKPRSSCRPGCIGKFCTYCCDSPLCNRPDNGPVTGSCNRQAMAQCLIELSESYTSTDTFECRSAEFALECLHHEKTQCQLGGATWASEHFSSLSLEAEVRTCLLKEASRTCAVEPITATTSFVSACGNHIPDLCEIVSANRKIIQEAEEECEDSDVRRIRRNVMAFEQSLGFLDCDEVTIGGQCDLSEAMKCLETVVVEKDTLVNCSEVTRVVECSREKTEKCRNGVETWLLEREFSSIKSKVQDPDCKVELLRPEDKDEAAVGIKSCLNLFLEALSNSGNAINGLTEAVKALQYCFVKLDPDVVLHMTAVQRLYVETIIDFTTTVIEKKIMIDETAGNSTGDPVCMEPLSELAQLHWMKALQLPYTAINSRKSVCSKLEDMIESVTNGPCYDDIASGNAYALSALDQIDKIRESFLVGFCSDIVPIRRCLVQRAEACLARFSTLLAGDIGKDEFCVEAKAFFTCGVKYTFTCPETNTDRISFRRHAQLAVDVATVRCYDQPEVIGERCDLLGQSGTDPGCDTSMLASCKLPEGDISCSAIEEYASCHVAAIGTCVENAMAQFTSTLVKAEKTISKCRQSDLDSGYRAKVSLERLFGSSCHQSPYKCDENEAQKCIGRLVEAVRSNTYDSSKLLEAKKCLEATYYCGKSIVPLLRDELTFDIIRQLTAWTPSFFDYSSAALVLSVRFPSSVATAIFSIDTTYMGLWSVCLGLDSMVEKLKVQKEGLSNVELPSWDELSDILQYTIQTRCNNVGDVATLLQFPVQENPTCKVDMIKARIAVLTARAAATYITPTIGNGNICRDYFKLEAALKSKLDDNELSLQDCSEGFKSVAKFSLSIAYSIGAPQCDEESRGNRRCDVKAAGKCVRSLYNAIMLLGKDTSEPDVCRMLDEQTECVEHFSYNCDGYRSNQIQWMWRSVKRAAEKMCVTGTRAAICEEGRDQDNTPCDIEKARECSLHQYRASVNPFLSREKVCRSLSQNMDCMQRYTKNCNVTQTAIPKLFLLDPDSVKEIQERLGCMEDNVDAEFGCRKGCMVDAAMKCFNTFKSGLKHYMWGQINDNTCSRINTLRTCVARETSECKSQEKRPIMKTLDDVLEHFDGHEHVCVDTSGCAGDFDDIFRLIVDIDERGEVIPDSKGSKSNSSDWEDTKDSDTKGTHDSDSDKDSGEYGNRYNYEVRNHPNPSLAAMCLRIEHIWNTCLQPGLRLLSSEKRETVMAMYKSIWATVEAKCQDTTKLKCYKCKNSDMADDCEKDMETCKISEKACMLEQTLDKGKVIYSAGCSKVKYCNKGDKSNSQRSCCYGSLCNTVASVADSPVTTEPATCQIDYALKCALDFTTSFIQSGDDKPDCVKTTQRLECVQRYAQTCTSEYSKTLIAQTEQVFLQLAKSSCVVEPEAGDCQSLALSSMQTILSNAYISEGNAPCIALRQTTESVQQTIESGNCSEAGRISLESDLAFVKGILGPYCDADSCQEVTEPNQSQGICSGYIFTGIKKIYNGLKELKTKLVDCESVTIMAEQASKMLANCGVPAFLEVKLKELVDGVEEKCTSTRVAELPPVCVGECQTDVVMEFIRDVREFYDNVTDTNTYCEILTELEMVYDKYTQGCTSVQQNDVVTTINLNLEEEIDRCRSDQALFTFTTELKKDVYYQTIVCQNTLRTKITEAFSTNDQKMLCEAVDSYKACQSNLPIAFEDFITGSTQALIDLIERASLCPYVDPATNAPGRKKRQINLCVVKVAELINELSVQPNIKAASFESRDLLCQDSTEALERARIRYVQCESTLSAMQKSMFEVVITNAAEEQRLLCVPLRFEEEGCNLNEVKKCYEDLYRVLHYSNIDSDSVCRKSLFTLDCTYRFSEGCDGAQQTEAENARLYAIEMVKSIVGNTCPAITNFLYCNGSLSDNTEACRMEEALSCAQAATPVATLLLKPGYCSELQDNVTCVQRSLVGCEAKQVAEVQLPEVSLKRFCNIDVDLNGVCTSPQACPLDTVKKCFETLLKDSSCSQLQKAFDCAMKIRNAYPLCQTSFGLYNLWIYYHGYYSTEIKPCSTLIPSRSSFNPDFEQPICASLVDAAAPTALKVFRGSADEVLASINNDAGLCVVGANAVASPLKYANMLIWSNIRIAIGVTGVDYSNLRSDENLKDETGCSYTRAIACITHKLKGLYAFQLLTGVEKTAFCRAHADKSVSECLKDTLVSCPNDKRNWFSAIESGLYNIVESMGICREPNLCMVSEAYACVNTFGAVLSRYDVNHNKQELCVGSAEAESCLKDFTIACSEAKKEDVKLTFKKLAARVNLDDLCEDVKLPPPPICPELPEDRRICKPLSAFNCIFSFSSRLLQGNSLVWRQQCMAIQNVMKCVATNTSSCKFDDPQLMMIKTNLNQFREIASDHCPWLSPSLCIEEKPCPVAKAGCEVALEAGLLNRNGSVCTLKQTADECVTNNTVTCTRAQINQAINNMDKKLTAAGLPKQLSCEKGEIEGYLYSFLATSADILPASGVVDQEACAKYTEEYENVNTHFMNPDGNRELTIAMGFVDAIFKNRVPLCSGNITDLRCAQFFDVKALAPLVTSLMMKTNISDASLCSQGKDLDRVFSRCDRDFMQSTLLGTSFYKDRCVTSVDCSQMETKISECIQSFGNFSSLNCTEKQQAANCVTKYYSNRCSYSPTWIPETDMCTDTILLHSLSDPEQYASEAGVYAQFTWYYRRGRKNFRVEIVTKASNPKTVPRCLKGPRENVPIPQVFYESSSSELTAASVSATFKVNARQDYRQDGPQTVDVMFRVVPFTIFNGNKFDDETAAFYLPSGRVTVADRTLPNAVCSSINDPHLRTFDDITYNNHEEGTFLMYRHTSYAEAVVVEYAMCAKYGSCNCGVRVYAGASWVLFDLCDPTNDLLTYSANATKLEQQRLRVLKERNQKTYHIILLESATLVKVQIEGEYMNVWVTPSSLDLGKTEGLCGVHDGDGYNDFRLPDGSIYRTKDEDVASGVRVPSTFNNAWKLTDLDSTAVYHPSVTIDTSDVPQYCHSWVEESGTVTTTCDALAHIASCGFVQGEDITKNLLDNLSQVGNGSSRKKRHAPIRKRSVQVPVWPTASNWTEEAAEEYCLDNLWDEPLLKCEEAVRARVGDLPDFDLTEAIDNCKDDIKLSDGVAWIPGARSSAWQRCIMELNQYPSYQSSAATSNLAIAFMDATCSPPDCSGHGTCSLGACECNTGYYGTACDIPRSALTPPVLKAPANGVHMCEVDFNSDCSSVFISGSNFVYSSELSCHIQEVEVTEYGVQRNSNGETRIVAADLIAADQVRCDLGSRSEMKRTVRVSVSNDGENEHSNYQLFMAYDPVCFKCDSTSCIRQNDVCVIGSACVRPGVYSVYNDCHFCDLRNPTEWTVRQDLERCQTSDSDNKSLTLALVGAGCAFLMLLIALVVGLVLYKRRGTKRHRRRGGAHNHAHTNPTFDHDGGSPFNGSPVLQIQTDDQFIDNLNGKTYDQYA